MAVVISEFETVTAPAPAQPAGGRSAGAGSASPAEPCQRDRKDAAQARRPQPSFVGLLMIGV